MSNEPRELKAQIWKRDSTNEWVLELSGTINDTAFISRHTEPLTTRVEDVARLPVTYKLLSRYREALVEARREACKLVSPHRNDPSPAQIGRDIISKIESALEVK